MIAEALAHVADVIGEIPMVTLEVSRQQWRDLVCDEAALRQKLAAGTARTDDYKSIEFHTNTGLVRIVPERSV